MSNKTFTIWMSIGLGSLCLIGILQFLSSLQMDFSLGPSSGFEQERERAAQHRAKMEKTFFAHKKDFDLLLELMRAMPTPQEIKITPQNYPALAKIGVIKVEHLKASNPVLFYMQTDDPDYEEGYLWSENNIREEVGSILYGDFYHYLQGNTEITLWVYSIEEMAHKSEKWHLFGSSHMF